MSKNESKTNDSKLAPVPSAPAPTPKTETQAPAPAPKTETQAPAPEAKVEEQKPKLPPYTIAKGKSLTTKKGILGPDDEVKVDYLIDGEAGLKRHVENGVIVKN